METPGIYVSFGSNIEPESNVLAAARLLAQVVRVVAVSTVYKTAAVGRPGQPPFHNGILRIETEIEPWALKFEVLRPIEEDLGRLRTSDKYAPRTIDLDLLLYGDMIVQTVGITVPDRDLLTRPFLAVALCELAGDIPLPGMGVRLDSVASALDKGSMRPLVAFTKLLRDEVLYGHRQG